jgi:hypothetical protein
LPRRSNAMLPHAPSSTSSSRRRGETTGNRQKPCRSTGGRNPQFAAGLRSLGSAPRRSGQHGEAVEVLQRAASVAPADAATWQGRRARSGALPEPHSNLGIVWHGRRAEAAFREAIHSTRLRGCAQQSGQPALGKQRLQAGSLSFGDRAPAPPGRRRYPVQLRHGAGARAPFRRSPAAVGGEPDGSIPNSPMRMNFWPTC